MEIASVIAVYALGFGVLYFAWRFFAMRDDRDKWRAAFKGAQRAAIDFATEGDRQRKMAEWLAGEAVRALKQFERIGGVIDDGPVTKELILKAADEAVEEADDGLS